MGEHKKRTPFFKKNLPVEVVWGSPFAIFEHLIHLRWTSGSSEEAPGDSVAHHLSVPGDGRLKIQTFLGSLVREELKVRSVWWDPANR